MRGGRMPPRRFGDNIKKLDDESHNNAACKIENKL
jgi:hypothetical protein